MSEGGGGGGASWLAAFSLDAPPPSPPVLGPGGFPEHIMDFHFPVMLLSINGPRIYLFSNESLSLLLGENLPMYLVEFGTNEHVKSHTNAAKSAGGRGTFLRSDAEISKDYCRSPEIPEWSRTYPTFFSHPQKKCTSRFYSRGIFWVRRTINLTYDRPTLLKAFYFSLPGEKGLFRHISTS